MIILHAGFLGDRLFVWGEAPLDQAMRATKRRGRKPKTPQSEALPYDAGAELLLGALSESVVMFPQAKPRTEQAIIWLPTVGGKPVASSPLIADQPELEEDVVLSPWMITALPLSVSESVELLGGCADRQIIGPGVIVGHDLAYWATALRFAGAIVARQQYLPGIANVDGAYHARWQPIFSGNDTERLSKLAAAMPAACRALSEKSEAPPEAPSVSVLSEFVGVIADHIVRSALTPMDQPAAKQRGRKAKPRLHSIHDQWLYALRTIDGIMEGDKAELARFASQVRDWRRPISVIAASPFRLCFRLEEPADDGELSAQEWQVRYLLQAADDPSLLIPARDAWNARGRKASVLKERNFNAREYLLSALGQASGVCPRVEASLRAAAPEGYVMDTSDAHEFLTQTSLMLEQAGFGVMLPAWWTRKGTKLHLSARANVKSPKMTGSGISLGNMLEVDWEVVLGGETLSYDELMALAKLKSPLVRLRGQWVQMGADDINAAIDFWKNKSNDKFSARDVVRMALGDTSLAGGMEVAGVSASGWIADLMAKLDGSAAFEELPTPGGFHGELRPYQQRGFSWLAFLREWGMGACLADDMGLGKTIQTLALIQQDWESNGKLPVLLICPMSVVGNWQKEAAKFTPELPVMIHHGATRTKGDAFQKKAEKHAIVVSSYALLHRDIEILKEVSWAGVILDEAQNIKNPQTRQAKSARSVEADYRIALTGTPVENNVGDLWSIMEFLNPSFLGSQADFKRSFFVPIQVNQDLEAADRLKRLTGPFILRRLKTDKSIIRDLPEKMEMKVFCNLTKEQASLYAAVVKDMEEGLEGAEGIERKGMILATLSKLKQVCNHPAQFLGDNSSVPDRSGKLARLTEMLEEIIETGDRALVFSQFAEMGAMLQRYLQETFGREALFLHGGVSKKQRDHMVERFQADGDGPSVFILSLKAGGTGLNLTKANHVFHFDRWWNPAVENQATDRAFRIGQTKNVQVHKFLCVGTLEEKIDEMIERKKEVAENVVGTGEGWLTELSTDQLKDIFALGKDAVGD